MKVMMNKYPRLAKQLSKAGIFRNESVCILDIGCAGGIANGWRVFGSDFVAYCFDADPLEIERLIQTETNTKIKYCNAIVGLDDDHPFLELRKKHQKKSFKKYFDHWNRTSSVLAKQIISEQGEKFKNKKAVDCLAQTKVNLKDYVKENGIKHVDFIKIDTDGNDLEVLISCEEIIRHCGVLGLCIEAPFTYSYLPTENTFHNIDRLMRKYGFTLYDMDVIRYSRRDLPAFFCDSDIPSKTISGQVTWADLVYFRDGGSEYYLEVWDKKLSLIGILKLASFFELFKLPDCAAELINIHKDRIAKIINPEILLDTLVPEMELEGLNNRLSYEDYHRFFRENMPMFMGHGRVNYLHK